VAAVEVAARPARGRAAAVPAAEGSAAAGKVVEVSAGPEGGVYPPTQLCKVPVVEEEGCRGKQVESALGVVGETDEFVDATAPESE
jgi:hypothetical protein